MTDEPLKPCPFCGSSEIVFEIYQPGVTNVYAIHCLGCDIQTKYYGDPYSGYKASEKNKSEAIAAWNRRDGSGLSIRDEVVWFAEMMEVTLKLNDHKGGWDKESVDHLFKRLKDEVQELQAALYFAIYDEEKIGECVDVANFAMMIAHNLSNNREDK